LLTILLVRVPSRSKSWKMQLQGYSSPSFLPVVCPVGTISPEKEQTTDPLVQPQAISTLCGPSRHPSYEESRTAAQTAPRRRQLLACISCAAAFTGSRRPTRLRWHEIVAGSVAASTDGLVILGLTTYKVLPLNLPLGASCRRTESTTQPQAIDAHKFSIIGWKKKGNTPAHKRSRWATA
jgi:hypothetical protein